MYRRFQNRRTVRAEFAYRILKSLFEQTNLPDKVEGVSEEELEAAYRNIWEMVEAEHILQVSPNLKFVRETDETLRDLLRYDLQQVILELTEQCNMRCRYCIYVVVKHFCNTYG